MGAFLPVSRGRRALALTGVALLFTTVFMLSSRSEGYRPNIDSAWLTSNIPLSIGNLAAHVPEEVYTAQRNKALAARVVDKEQFGELEVVLWEEGIHDEVVGAIGNSLYHIGVEPIFDVHFRFSFPDVLKDLVQPDPLIERPVGAEPAINKRLADDSIDILILTTCRFSLEKHYEMIKPSKAHVVCFWHAGNLAPEPSLRKLMHELSLEERITVLVLGNAVQKTMQFKFDEWAEKDANLGWGKLPIDLFVPVFDWPAKSDKVRPAVYPTTVMIQGNLDRYRRGYAKIFEHLEASLIEDASVWGYRAGATPDSPWEPVASGSPLQLQLMGQPVPNMPLEIPEKLSNIVSIHEKLPYPEYYQLLSNADLLLPAFAQSGYYWDTASSSIAAAAIGRVPVLGSRRLWKAYDYLAGPVVVNKEISTPDIEAVHRLRKANDYVMPPDINEQWEAMFDRIRDRNDICWAKIMRRAKKLKHLAY